MGYGALPMQTIREMIERKQINGVPPEVIISPASFDLTISQEAYRLEEGFPPPRNEAVRETLRQIGHSPHDLAYPLERGVTYLIRLNQSLALQNDVYGYCNPKSTSGRNFVRARVVADFVDRYDSAEPAGYQGGLWQILRPRAYPLKIEPGQSFSQIRFFNHNTRFSLNDLIRYFDHDRLFGNGNRSLSYEELQNKDRDGTLNLRLDLGAKVAGWECLGVNRVLEFGQNQHYNPLEFFRPMRIDRDRVHLRKEGHYLFQTKEWVRVPPWLALEMISMDRRFGDFISHEAGFIDPGWGWGKDGAGRGRPLVLEVITVNEDMPFYDGQIAARVWYERMVERPDQWYDQLATASYAIDHTDRRPPQLARQFRMPESV